MLTHKEKDNIICMLNHYNIHLQETLEKIKPLVESSDFMSLRMQDGYSKKIEEIREIVDEGLKDR